jgi:hypothetical protein
MRGALDRGRAMMAMGGVEEDEEGPPPSQYFTLPVKFYSRRASFAVPSKDGRGLYYIDAPIVRKWHHDYIYLVNDKGWFDLPVFMKNFTQVVNLGGLPYVNFAPNVYNSIGTTFGIGVFVKGGEMYYLPVKVEHKSRGGFFVWAHPGSPDAPLRRVPLRELVEERWKIKSVSLETPMSKKLSGIGKTVTIIMGAIGVLGIIGGVEITFWEGVSYLAILAAGIALYIKGKTSRVKVPALMENPKYREKEREQEPKPVPLAGAAPEKGAKKENGKWKGKKERKREERREENENENEEPSPTPSAGDYSMYG